MYVYVSLYLCILLDGLNREKKVGGRFRRMQKSELQSRWYAGYAHHVNYHIGYFMNDKNTEVFDWQMNN